MLGISIAVPRWRLVTRNQPAALLAAARVVADAQRARLESGDKSSGAAMHDRDGTRPLYKTGAMDASITAALRSPTEAFAGPTGDRARVAAILATKGFDCWRPTPDDRTRALAAFDSVAEYDAAADTATETTVAA